jgi:hypothetical protein
VPENAFCSEAARIGSATRDVTRCDVGLTSPVAGVKRGRITRMATVGQWAEKTRALPKSQMY